MVLCYAQASNPFITTVPVGFDLPNFAFAPETFTENPAQIDPNPADGIIHLAAGGVYAVSYRVTGAAPGTPPVPVNFTTQLFLGGVPVPGSIGTQDVNFAVAAIPVNAAVAGNAIVRVPAGPGPADLTIRNISIPVPGGAVATDFIDFSITVLRIR